MDTTTGILVDGLERIENALAAVYHHFLWMFPLDADFWGQLMKEERGHAMLVRTHREFIIESPDLAQFLERLSVPLFLKTVIHIEDLLVQMPQSPPSRSKAITLALWIEKSAGELHYDAMMSVSSRSVALKAIQNLFHGDTDHIKRIEAYGRLQGLYREPQI
jgi:hypothetical protein